MGELISGLDDQATTPQVPPAGTTPAAADADVAGLAALAGKSLAERRELALQAAREKSGEPVPYQPPQGVIVRKRGILVDGQQVEMAAEFQDRDWSQPPEPVDQVSAGQPQ